MNQFESNIRLLRHLQVQEIKHLQDLMNSLLRGVRAQPESVIRGITKKLDILEAVSLAELSVSVTLTWLQLIRLSLRIAMNITIP